MRPTEAEALKQAMVGELDEETYEKILERAEDIRTRS
jgi:hypothetical protein